MQFLNFPKHLSKSRLSLVIIMLIALKDKQHRSKTANTVIDFVPKLNAVRSCKVLDILMIIVDVHFNTWEIEHPRFRVQAKFGVRKTLKNRKNFSLIWAIIILQVQYTIDNHEVLLVLIDQVSAVFHRSRVIIVFAFYNSHYFFSFLLWGHVTADMELSVCNRVWLPFEIYIAWHFVRVIFSFSYAVMYILKSI